MKWITVLCVWCIDRGGRAFFLFFYSLAGEKQQCVQRFQGFVWQSGIHYTEILFFLFYVFYMHALQILLEYWILCCVNVWWFFGSAQDFSACPIIWVRLYFIHTSSIQPIYLYDDGVYVSLHWIYNYNILICTFRIESFVSM